MQKFVSHYDSYVRCIIAKYGNGAVVIFDGYAGPPITKSEEQKWRLTTRMSAYINEAEGDSSQSMSGRLF